MASVTSKSEVLLWIAAILLFLVVLFSKPVLVGSVSCQGRGHINITDGLCACQSPFYGVDCQFQYCPHGESWSAVPQVSHYRNFSRVPCSGMGSCNPINGECQCREGFEGRACERLACPTRQLVSFLTPTVLNIAIRSTFELKDKEKFVPCSGHGKCFTQREFGSKFDGRALIRPPVDYNNWEADKMQACVCDDGWNGVDCSYRSCPKGLDPLSDDFPYARQNEYVIQCQADSGYFSILIQGSYTDPIPYDADPAYLKFALESVHLVGPVTVIMPSSADFTPKLCGVNSIISTTVILNEHFGELPPIYLSPNTTATRQWPLAGNGLQLSGSVPTLRMATINTLSCTECPDCTGKVYFTFGSSVSKGVNITSSSHADITEAIESLTDLVTAGYTNLIIDVTGSPNICDKAPGSAAATTTTITMYSDYGNLPALGIIDGSSGGTNITMTSTAGNGTLHECSNQGHCDRSMGICQCFSFQGNSEQAYRVVSSDGKGNRGNRGDCGHIETPVQSCISEGRNICSGHGACQNSSATCDCQPGWSGINCAVKSCPLGHALVDEPINSTRAHSLVECSANGLCHHETGQCLCQDGYSGPACDLWDCPRDRATGDACSGHGYCYTMNELYKLYGLEYGDRYDQSMHPQAWDAINIKQCVCSAPSTVTDVLHDPARPAVGPRAEISGTSGGSPPLPGWTGWDCSKRRCPMGDATDKRHGGGGLNEVQRIVCNFNNITNTSRSFTLNVLGKVSQPIFTNYQPSQIAEAIEFPASVGNVTVWFPNFGDDSILSACHDAVNNTFGGFLVRFDTEQGDISTMTIAGGDLDLFVNISEVTKGTSINEECGGDTMGICDRSTGMCLCGGSYGSSNSSNYPGNRGDCAWLFARSSPGQLSERTRQASLGIGLSGELLV